MHKTISDMQLLQGACLICAALLSPVAGAVQSAADRERDELERRANQDVRVSVDDATLQAVLDILNDMPARTSTTAAQGRLESELGGSMPASTSGLPSPSSSPSPPGTAAGAGNARSTASAPRGNAPSGSGAPIGNSGQREGEDGQGRDAAGSGRPGARAGNGGVSINSPTGDGGMFPVFNPPDQGKQPPGDANRGDRPQGVGGVWSPHQGLDDILGSLDQQIEDFAKQGRGRSGSGPSDAESTPEQEQVASVPEGVAGNRQDGYYDPNAPQASEQTENDQRDNTGPSQNAPDYSTGSGYSKSGSIPAGGNEAKDTEQIPPDLRDVSNDDIVARQLREAAMAEQDPELKEKLWEEYRKYKNI